jgi:hypothetical protein
MDNDGKTKNMENNTPRQHISNMSNDSTFLQSIWVRCRTVFSDIMDREFMESESRFVLYCGTIFWIIFLLSQTF